MKQKVYDTMLDMFAELVMRKETYLIRGVFFLLTMILFAIGFWV